MKHLSEKWLRALHFLYLGLDVVILIAIDFQRLHHESNSISTHWGLSSLVATLIGIHLVYGFTVFFWINRKNKWLATLVSQILFDMIIAALIQASGFNNLAYRISWISTISLSAALGPYIVMSEVAVNAVINLLFIFGIVKATSYHNLTELILTLAAAMAGLIGWLIARHYYEEQYSSSDVGLLTKQLHQEQSQSNIIIESIADGVIVFDKTGKINLINPAAVLLTDWPQSEAIGLDIHLIMKLAQEDGKTLTDGSDIFLDIFKSEQSISRIYQLISRGDKHAVISLAVSPVTNTTDGVIGGVAVFRDITQEREEEKQRADFISTASHEMRTPVAAIEGYLALALNDKVSTIDTKAREYLEKAHESTQHLGKLFQDLLTSAKAEDGRLSSHPVVVEMGDFLEKLTDGLRFAAQKKQLNVEFLIGSNEVIDATESKGSSRVLKPFYYVNVDPDRIREVITNLFDNAVKYTDQGKISIGITGDNEVVQLYIRDTGPGIPPDDIPHLFQKFYRVDNSTTRTVGGTGLGLFISRKIVELYNGHIWVESKLNSGSTFYINLPRLTSQNAQDLQAREASQTILPTINSLASP